MFRVGVSAKYWCSLRGFRILNFGCLKFFEHLEIRSRKPSADHPDGPSGSMDHTDIPPWNIESEERLHHENSRYQNKNTRRPSFIPTDEISAGTVITEKPLDIFSPITT